MTLSPLDHQILESLEFARKLNSKKMGSKFESIEDNKIQPTTEKQPKKSVLFRESELDKENKEIEKKINSILYKNTLEFSDLAFIGFLTLKQFSNIELFEEGTKESNLLLSHLENVRGSFNE